MGRMNRWLLASLLVGGSRGAWAQAPAVLDEAAARKNIVKRPAPVYPAIAQAAHIAGSVVVKVEIDKWGHVKTATAVSGPEMLRPAALDAVKQWGFRAFERDGKAVPVETRLTVPFAAHAAEVAGGGPGAAAEVKTPAAEAAPETAATHEANVAQEFAMLEGKCRELVAARAEGEAEVDACRAAALQAEKFGTDRRYMERRSSYVFYATALMRTNELKKAELYGTRAIALVKQGHDDDSGGSAAYAVRAQAEAFAGELTAADRDLVIAEDFQRKAIAGASGGAAKDDAAGLRSLLEFHGKVLGGLGKKDAAAAKLAEAAKL